MTKFVALLSALALSVNCVTALWPLPKQFSQGNDTIWLSQRVTLEFGAANVKACGKTAAQGSNYDSSNSSSRGSKIVRDAWQRTTDALFKQNIVPWKFHPRGSNFEPSISSGAKLSKVVVSQTGKDVKSSDAKYGKFKEGYKLTIPGGSCDTIFIEAESTLGVLHAFRTLEQLFYAPAKPRGYVWGKGSVSITDEPKFSHRGVNLDVARQWYPVEAIQKVINAMSWNKFNRLHLHVTDSQSWPLEIPALPELAQKGKYAPGLTYSPEDLQNILDYAEARGIQVIVEIDMPGHTTSIAEAYPDLIVGKNIQPNWWTYAAQPPSGSLKLNNKKVEAFLSKLFRDLLPRLNKHTSYFHTGGDEVNSNVYYLDEGVKSNVSTEIQPHLQKFFSHVQKEVEKQGMTTFVWEEMLLHWNLTVPKSTVVQIWQTDEAAKQATEKGYQIIGGNYNYWYLDCGHGQWLDFGPDAFAQRYPFNDYCFPRKNWRLIYSYSPDQGLTEEEAKLVLGGEVHVWSEQIDMHSVDTILWPRASAAAEVLWTGRIKENGENRTFAEITPRLGEFRERMVAKGVGASPITQLWCHQNEGDCAINVEL